MSDLWTTASADVEAEQYNRRLTEGRIAAASAFTFAAQANSESDLDNRLALVDDRVEKAAREVVGDLDLPGVYALKDALVEDIRATVASTLPKGGKTASKIDTLRKIVEDHQYAVIDGQNVDVQTANAIVMVYDALKDEANKAKFETLPIGALADFAWKHVSSKGIPESRWLVEAMARNASEGQTCSVCGDKIAKDPSGEEPATWHHDNGEKHDHEAKPAGDSKESQKTAGVYCNTHQVWVGDGNASTHEDCSKEQKATEKTKDARKHGSYKVVDDEGKTVETFESKEDAENFIWDSSRESLTVKEAATGPNGEIKSVCEQCGQPTISYGGGLDRHVMMRLDDDHTAVPKEGARRASLNEFGGEWAPWTDDRLGAAVEAAIAGLSPQSTAAEVVARLSEAFASAGGYRDSIDREHAFTDASEATGIDYNDIYDAWLAHGGNWGEHTSSCKQAGAPSTVCPDCGGPVEPLIYNYDGISILRATCDVCGWTGHKQRKTEASMEDLLAEANLSIEAMLKGAPFAGYDDFDACVAANSDKDDPEAYCGKIKHQVEDGKESRKQAGFGEPGPGESSWADWAQGDDGTGPFADRIGQTYEVNYQGTPGTLRVLNSHETAIELHGDSGLGYAAGSRFMLSTDEATDMLGMPRVASRKQAEWDGTIPPAGYKPDVDFGEHYGGDTPSYMTPDGPVWMYRKGQKVRFYDIDGNQVGPEQSNVAPAMAYAQSEGWDSGLFSNVFGNGMKPFSSKQAGEVPEQFKKKDEAPTEEEAPAEESQTVEKFKVVDAQGNVVSDGFDTEEEAQAFIDQMGQDDSDHGKDVEEEEKPVEEKKPPFEGRRQANQFSDNNPFADSDFGDKPQRSKPEDNVFERNPTPEEQAGYLPMTTRPRQRPVTQGFE